jgi:multiple sugar transport system substrate-binding protein
MNGRHILFGAIAALVLAAACTAGGGEESPAIVNPSASHEPVTLTMWSGFQNPEFGYLNNVIDGFEQKYPWITVNTVPGKQDTQVLNAIHSGTAPDVVMLTVPDDAIQFCASGAYIDLGPYIRADNIDLRSLVPEGALGYTALATPKSQCMLPMLTDAYGLYYNTDMFQKAGISSPPRTYSELFADAKKLTQLNPDGSIKVAGFLPIETADYEFANVVNGVQEGADWYDSSGNCRLGTDPRFAQMLEFYKSMADWYGYDNISRFFSGNGGENTEFSASNLFENEKVAMVSDGEWRVNFIENVDKSNVPYATAPYPVPDDSPDRYGVGQIGGSTLGVPRGTDHPGEAWLLVKYLALDKGAETSLARQLRNVPTLKSVLSDPVLTKDQNFQTFLDIFANPESRYKQITEIGFGDVSLYDGFVDKYLAGKVSDVKAGLEGVCSQIEQQIKLGQ